MKVIVDHFKRLLHIKPDFWDLPLHERMRELDQQKQERLMHFVIFEEPEKDMVKGYINTGNVYLDMTRLDIGDSYEIYEESTEFSWGFAGAGPAQLSVAILMMLLPLSKVAKYQSDFEHEVIAKLPPLKSFSIPIGFY